MIRLQKIIAARTRYSRRRAEEIIASGAVKVNGRVVMRLGTKVDPLHSRIEIFGKTLGRREEYCYLLFHKPAGVMVTRLDPEGRKTVYDYLPRKYHDVKPVGRLDYNSRGLMLLTDDGDYAQSLLHPDKKIKKIYEVKLSSHPSPWQIDRLKQPVLIDGRKTQPAEVSLLKKMKSVTWLKIVLHEGRNRQIRRQCEQAGLSVKSLIRTQIGPYRLGGLPAGKYISVTRLSL